MYVEGNGNIVINGDNNIINTNLNEDIKYLIKSIDEIKELLKKDRKMDKVKLPKKIKKKLVKAKSKEQEKAPYKFDICDFDPSPMFLPKKYYTAKMRWRPEVSYLNEGDIIIIDPTVQKVRDSGIYAFEYKGAIAVRQFQLMPWGHGDVKGKLAYRSVGSTTEEVYPHDEVNIIGAVVSKQVELFHGLYYNNPMRRAFGLS